MSDEIWFVDCAVGGGRARWWTRGGEANATVDEICLSEMLMSSQPAGRRARREAPCVKEEAARAVDGRRDDRGKPAGMTPTRRRLAALILALWPLALSAQDAGEAILKVCFLWRRASATIAKQRPGKERRRGTPSYQT